MRHHIHALFRALRIDHETAYCPAHGGWYPASHFPCD